MSQGCIVSRFTVAGLDGAEDRLVPSQAGVRPVGHVQIALPRFTQQIEYDVVQPQQDVVVRSPRQGVVERRVLVDEWPSLRDALALALEQALELANVLGSRSRRRAAGDARLDQLAHLEHL